MQRSVAPVSNRAGDDAAVVPAPLHWRAGSWNQTPPERKVLDRKPRAGLSLWTVVILESAKCLNHEQSDPKRMQEERTVQLRFL